jgi:hypothetical protein
MAMVQVLGCAVLVARLAQVAAAGAGLVAWCVGSVLAMRGSWVPADSVLHDLRWHSWYTVALVAATSWVVIWLVQPVLQRAYVNHATGMVHDIATAFGDHGLPHRGRDVHKGLFCCQKRTCVSWTGVCSCVSVTVLWLAMLAFLLFGVAGLFYRMAEGPLDGQHSMFTVQLVAVGVAAGAGLLNYAVKPKYLAQAPVPDPDPDGDHYMPVGDNAGSH